MASDANSIWKQLIASAEEKGAPTVTYTQLKDSVEETRKTICQPRGEAGTKEQKEKERMMKGSLLILNHVGKIGRALKPFIDTPDVAAGGASSISPTVAAATSSLQTASTVLSSAPYVGAVFAALLQILIAVNENIKVGKGLIECIERVGLFLVYLDEVVESVEKEEGAEDAKKGATFRSIVTVLYNDVNTLDKICKARDSKNRFWRCVKRLWQANRELEELGSLKEQEQFVLIVRSTIDSMKGFAVIEAKVDAGNKKAHDLLDKVDLILQALSLSTEQQEEPKLTAARFLTAKSSKDKSDLYSQYIWRKPERKDLYVEGFTREDAFISHYGLDTKINLVVPFARTMKEIYGHSFFVDCEPDNAYTKSQGTTPEVLCRALWSVPVVFFIISRNFHKSKWCLWELYTALYRAECEGDLFKIHIFYYGVDPGLCEGMDEYKGLGLGTKFGTLYKFETMSLETFAVDNMHPTVRQLIMKDDNAELQPRAQVMAEFRKHCPLNKPKSKPKSLLVGAFHVPQVLPYFQGREDEMNELTQLLKDQSMAMVVPHGAGGVGKTQLVSTWVNKNVNLYSAILWLRAEQELTLMADLVSFSHMVGLSSPSDTDGNEEEVAKRVIKTIETHSKDDLPVLVVYDNAERYETIKKWIPANGSACHTIITTRDSSSLDRDSLLWVGRLDPKSSIRIVEYFLKRTLEEPDRKEILILFDLLDFLALAIVAFATQASSLGLSRAIRRFHDRRQEALDRKLKLGGHYQGDNRESVSTVLHMQLEALSPAALVVLEYLSVVEADRVPLSLLDASFNESDDLDMALEELQEKAVLIYDGENELIHTHRLLQDSAWEAMSEERRTSVLNRVGSELDTLMESVDMEAGRNESLTSVVPHALAIVDRRWPNESQLLGALFDHIGSTQYYAGNYEESLTLHERGLAVQISVHGKDHQDVAINLNNMGQVYDKQGLHDKALEMYGQTLSIYKTSLANNHPSVAATLDNMGQVYHNQGLYDKALELYEKALSIRRASLADNHPDVATTLNNMGLAYDNQGLYDKALELLEQAFSIRKTSLGDNHPEVATTLNNMAGVYNNQGLYHKALELYDQALSIRMASLGDNHPSVATTVNNMALVYDNQGLYDKALELYEQALSISKASLGDNHPNVATTLNNMALVCNNQGLHDKALELCEQALCICKASLGDSHPDVATTLNNMAGVYDNQGLYDKALELYEHQALSISKASLGDSHPSVATTLNNMAHVYRNQGLYVKALELFQQALSIQRAFLPTDHPYIAQGLNDIDETKKLLAGD